MPTELTDVEKARLAVLQARRQHIDDWRLVVKPLAAPTPVESALRPDKSQGRFRGWIMAALVLGVLAACGVAGYSVYLVCR